MNRHSDFIEQRNKLIWKMYLKERATLKYRSVGEIAQAISEMPVERFYISDKSAEVEYHRFFIEGKRTHTFSAKKKIYTAFLQECFYIRKSAVGALLTQSEIIYRAMHKPAPCIGLAPFTIFNILRHMGAK